MSKEIETITLVLGVVLMVMVMLLGILCILYFKSKNKKQANNTDNKLPENSKSKTAKNYSVESVFDFMEFDKIEDNMISTKNESKYVMVVECQGVNYDLMSEVEKNAVEEGFIQFLNTLRHPVQICTQTRTINLESSIEAYRTKVKAVEEQLEKQKKEYEQMVRSGRYSQEQLNAAFYELTKTTNLYEYGKDIIYTTEKMSLNKNVLNQKYYIVIPYYPEDLGENNFDKQEIRNIAFSELYTRAQSIVRTLSVCGVTGKVLDSNELVDLLYVAYNRDDSETYGVDKAIDAGYNELYSTAPDVMDKKMKAIDEKIEKEAFEKANLKVLEAKSEKQKEVERKEENLDDLIDQMAQVIINQNKSTIGNDVANRAINKIQEETVARKKRGRPKKQVSQPTTNESANVATSNTSVDAFTDLFTEEGGTKDEEEGQEKRARTTKTA